MSVVALLIAVCLLVQLPAVQTAIAGKVMEKLDKSIDAEIHLDKIHFQPFKTLMLKNVVIIDREPMGDVLDSTKAPVDTFSAPATSSPSSRLKDCSAKREYI